MRTRSPAEIRYRYRLLRTLARAAGAIIVVCTLIASTAAARDRDDWQMPDRVMADMNLPEGGTVADVGCGRGYFTFRMARAVGDDGKVLAVDIKKSSLQDVRRKADDKNLSNIRTIHSRPADASLPQGMVDSALLCLVLHHADRDVRQDLVSSIVEHLEPGGCLFVLEFRKKKGSPFHDYDELVSRQKTVQLARNAGLELDAEYYYLPHQYFLRFRRPLPE